MFTLEEKLVFQIATLKAQKNAQKTLLGHSSLKNWIFLEPSSGLKTLTFGKNVRKNEKN